MLAAPRPAPGGRVIRFSVSLALTLVCIQSLWGTPLVTDALTPLMLLVACSSKSSEQGARCPSCPQSADNVAAGIRTCPRTCRTAPMSMSHGPVGNHMKWCPLLTIVVWNGGRYATNNNGPDGPLCTSFFQMIKVCPSRPPHRPHHLAPLDTCAHVRSQAGDAPQSTCPCCRRSFFSRQEGLAACGALFSVTFYTAVYDHAKRPPRTTCWSSAATPNPNLNLAPGPQWAGGPGL